jgi:hypothetical protein
MRIQAIKWEGEIGNGFLVCPSCEKVWFVDDQEQLRPCECLAFVWPDQADPEFYNGFDADRFHKAYAEAYEKHCGIEGEKLGSEEWVVDYRVLKALSYKELKGLYSLTESGLACGPVSFTTFFGLQTDFSKEK